MAMAEQTGWFDAIDAARYRLAEGIYGAYQWGEKVANADVELGQAAKDASTRMAAYLNNSLGDTLVGTSTAEEMLKMLQDSIGKWGAAMTDAAQNVFWYLALISLFFSVLLPVVQGEARSLGDVFTPVVKWTITIGVFYFVLNHGVEIFSQTTEWFKALGAKQASADNSPLALLNKGLEIAMKALAAVVKLLANATNGKSGFDAVMAVIIAVVISLCLIALTVVIVYLLAECTAKFITAIVTGWIFANIGVIVLGFGGHALGRDLVIAYFRKAVAIGLQIMAIYFLAFVGAKMVDTLIEKGAQSNFQVSILIAVIGFCVVFKRLIDIVPDMLAGMVGNGANLGQPVYGMRDFAHSALLLATPFTAGAGAAAGAAVSGFQGGAAKGAKAGAAAGHPVAGAALAIGAGLGNGLYQGARAGSQAFLKEAYTGLKGFGEAMLSSNKNGRDREPTPYEMARDARKAALAAQKEKEAAAAAKEGSGAEAGKAAAPSRETDGGNVAPANKDDGATGAAREVSARDVSNSAFGLGPDSGGAAEGAGDADKGGGNGAGDAGGD